MMNRRFYFNFFFLLNIAFVGNAFAVCDPAMPNPADCACVLDLNGDGEIADENEMQQCSNVADGGLCGIDKQNCVMNPPPPEPAPGYYCPLTGLTDGCTQGAHNYVLDPATQNYDTTRFQQFINDYSIGAYYVAAVNNNLDAWNTSITCENPNVSTGRIDTELCTNPPAPDPVAAPGYYCPLTGQTSGCYKGLHAYAVDPYTGQLHQGPRTPNHTDFQALSVGASYTNLVGSDPMNFLTAVSCQSGSSTVLCETPPAHWNCPVAGGGACTTGAYSYVYTADPMLYAIQLVGFMNTHTPTQRFNDYTSANPATNWANAVSCQNTANPASVDLCDWTVPPVPTPPPDLVLLPEPSPPPPPPAPEYGCPDGVSQCLPDDSDGGVMRCSPTECGDMSISTAGDPMSTAMYYDDAGYDNDGNCLGEMYIFNGRAMRCHPKSIKTYFRNCCSHGLVDDAIPENVGKEAEMALQLEGIYIAGYVMFSAASATIQAAVGVAGAPGWGAAASAGAGVAAGEQAVAELFGGWNLAFISLTALNYLYANACDQIDFETVLLDKSGFCYEYGTRCVDDSDVFGCLKKQTTYCCFNSKLARIIHEQGRPQITNVDWGDIDQPNCRGFTPLEFQSLDFSRIDLSEYYGHVQAELEEDFPDMQNTIESDVQDSIQGIR